MELLERGPLLDELGGLLAAARHGRGRMVVLEGEAGIGKTTLLEAFLRERARRVRVLRGACRPGEARRPFAPLRDIVAAGDGGSDLGPALKAGNHEAVARATLALLRTPHPPMVLAIEDVHWADDATLDLLGTLGSRLRDMAVLVLATRRDDEPGEASSLDRVLADVPRQAAVRLAVPPLTLGAVRGMVARHGVDAAALHEATGGNPFLVAEAMRGTPGVVPASIHGAVAARISRLPAAAREVLAAAAVIGRPAPPGLLGEVADRDEPADAIAALVRARLLVLTQEGLEFRHDLVRLAVLDGLGSRDQRRLHRRALVALARTSPIDVTRLAGHAIGARDRVGIGEWGTAAAGEALRLGSYRQAAVLYGAVLRAVGDRLPMDRRASLLEAHAEAAAGADDVTAAIRSQRAALRLRRRAGDRVGEGAALRAMAELWWLSGDGPRAMAAAQAAVDLLAEAPGGRAQLAAALATLAQRHLVAASPPEVAYDVGERAYALAEELGLEATAVHALTTLGALDAYGGRPGGIPEMHRLEAAAERAKAADLTGAVTRAVINLAEAALHFGRLDEAATRMAVAIEWLESVAIDDIVHLRMLRMRQADLDLARGRWDDAARAAREILDLGGGNATANQIRVRAATILGRLYARCGQSDPWPLLDEGRSLVGVDELQELGPLYAARIEASLLEGDRDRATAEANAALDMLRRTAPIPDFLAGEAWSWAWRAGVVRTLPDEVPEPFRLEAAGRFRAAADAWAEIGNPYLRALDLVALGNEPELREALEVFLGLGARPMARLASDRLRELGASGIPRGPRRRTRANPAGLTDRQIEILALLGRGARNADIASRLVISEKTVDHHVSAVLRALGVRNRRAAGRRALELGLEPGASPKDGEFGTPNEG